MGCSHTKDNSIPREKTVQVLKNKVRLLEGEINEIMRIREEENQNYEHELMVFASKQEEWKRERKRLKWEVKKLRNNLKEKEEKLRRMEKVGENFENEWEMLRKNCIMQHIKEEQMRRDETVEKWKQLYFAIKLELDDLIVRTHQAQENMSWTTEKESKLKKELKVKEEKIEFLHAKLGSLEDQELKREREMDILRQSLRIMIHSKKATRFVRKCPEF